MTTPTIRPRIVSSGRFCSLNSSLLFMATPVSSVGGDYLRLRSRTIPGRDCNSKAMEPRASRAATGRDELLDFFGRAAINRRRFAFVIGTVDDDLHFAVAIEVEHGKHGIAVRSA